MIFVSFEPQLEIYYGDGSWQQMQNFSIISPKLRQLDQKTQGHGV